MASVKSVADEPELFVSQCRDVVFTAGSCCEVTSARVKNNLGRCCTDSCGAVRVWRLL